MTGPAERIGELTGAGAERIRPIAGGDLSQVFRIDLLDGRVLAAKCGRHVAIEADMLRAIRNTGVAAPRVERTEDDILLMAFVESDGSRGWADIGTQLARLHSVTRERYGWHADYTFGDVVLDNAQTDDWPEFWFAQRLVKTAAPLEADWRHRVEALEKPLEDILPASPAAALLHGDLWAGNILTHAGKLAALIDPACYYGHAEVDLAMLTLFGSPDEGFRDAYGALESGWELRRAAYQLFPALVHLRLFGSGYAPMVDGLLHRLGA